MRLCRACLVALLLAFSSALGIPAAHAASLDEALAHFTADDFDQTEIGINDVAGSGSPRAELILRDLEDGRLMFSAERKAVYIQDETGKLTSAATGNPIAGDRPADLDNVRVNNRLRATIDAALGALTLFSSDPNTRYAAAQAVFKSRPVSALPAVEKALASETNSSVKRALEQAQAAIVLNMSDATDAQKLAAISVIRKRGDQDSLGLLFDIPGRE